MSQRVVIVVFDGFQLLDMAGPVDVFNAARHLVRPPCYEVVPTALRAGTVRTGDGISVVVETALDDIEGPIDTLVVAGGFDVAEHLADAALLDGVARLSRMARRTASVCSGAFVLAEAGLLDGKRATTHWLLLDELRRRFPSVTVERDALYVNDGGMWSSAGVTAGVDLALALVAEDHGHSLAGDIARGLVVYLHRPGGQSQFSRVLSVRTPQSAALRELQVWIDSHPDDDLSVPALARRANMSERHFSRVFTDQVGVPPGRYVELSRTDAAQRLLERTDDSLASVARQVGLGLPQTLHRVFVRHLHVSPSDYRRRFRTKDI
ncbi:GlxA family transcriptional regulator [Sinosporangium album]|nr:GlxA family transcriptional regulator [Sinosporangium album]